MKEEFFDCIVIGAGPAGLSSALYLARGGIKSALVDISIFGGQPVNYLEIENYLGIYPVLGYELAEKFEQHIDKFNVEKFPNEEIQEINLLNDTKTITTLNYILKAKSVIIATGASPLKLNISGEEKFKGRGVSYCAVCDGAFYKDKILTVIGGGNSAIEEGIYLTKFAKKVYIMHRREEFRADRILVERALQNKKIEFILNSTPLEILGENKVSSIKYKNQKTNETKTLDTEGVFPYIGLVPNVEFLKNQLKQDEFGFILTDEKMETSQKGVFAAGDVRKTPLRQVITAVSDGAVAGVFAVKYIEETVLKEKLMRA